MAGLVAARLGSRVSLQLSTFHPGAAVIVIGGFRAEDLGFRVQGSFKGLGLRV